MLNAAVIYVFPVLLQTAPASLVPVEFKEFRESFRRTIKQNKRKDAFGKILHRPTDVPRTRFRQKCSVEKLQADF